MYGCRPVEADELQTERLLRADLTKSGSGQKLPKSDQRSASALPRSHLKADGPLTGQLRTFHGGLRTLKEFDLSAARLPISTRTLPCLDPAKAFRLKRFLNAY